MSGRAAQRKCGSHDGDPHHPSMAGFSVAELLKANPAIVSAEVLWVAPAIVVGWGIPAIAKAVAPAVAVAPTTTVVAPAAVMTPAMATPGHCRPGRTDAGERGEDRERDYESFGLRHGSILSSVIRAPGDGLGLRIPGLLGSG